MQRTIRVLLVGALLCFAAGAVAGVAAADDPTDGTTIDFDIDAGTDDEGIEGGFTCEGAVTDHDCDKGGEANLGPVHVDYAEGFNGGNLLEGEYAFGDTFIVTVEDEGAAVGFTCEFEDEPPEDNPCPVEFDEAGDDGEDADDDEQQNGDNGQGDENNDAPDHSERP